MKHSIRVRLVVMVAVLIGGTILLCWIINKAFLSDYYERYKINMLGDAYETVKEKYTKQFGTNEEDSDAKKAAEDLMDLDNEITIALESLGANQGLSLYVFRLYQTYAGISPEFIYPLMDVKRQTQVFEQILPYLNIGNKEFGERQLLSHTEDYWIYKVYDKRMGSYYLELIGLMDKGTTNIYVRSNYQSMLESVEISNQFLAYIGLFATVVGIILMYLMSQNFTKPIQKLTKIATSMSHLNFDVKYHVTRQDEIGTLGTSINLLSEKLEQTISMLKTANNELQKDIEQKTKLDEMRTEFLSNVSHELKTPIALIQGYAEGLTENINDDEESRRFYCDVIVDEAAKMNQMVKKLLSLNHIEFGENPVQFERFDLVSLLRSVLDSTNILFTQKEATLYFEDYEPIYVWADEYKVEEVITNYISNAIHHVSGQKIIEVKLIQKEEGVRVAVFNTGEPIPADDLDRLWDKFYKVDKARTREYGGSGIGLSIVKAIMMSINQNYGVVNHETGVEFWFELDTRTWNEG